MIDQQQFRDEISERTKAIVTEEASVAADKVQARVRIAVLESLMSQTKGNIEVIQYNDCMELRIKIYDNRH